MQEFEPSSEAWKWNWSSSSLVGCLESGMEEFETSSMLRIGNGRVQAQFRRLES